jgi:hypothetical protein
MRDEVVGFSIFHSRFENDESEEDDSEEDAPEEEEEDNVVPGARGPQNGTSSEASSFRAFQFTIPGEKFSLN